MKNEECRMKNANGPERFGRASIFHFAFVILH